MPGIKLILAQCYLKHAETITKCSTTMVAHGCQVHFRLFWYGFNFNLNLILNFVFNSISISFPISFSTSFQFHFSFVFNFVFSFIFNFVWFSFSISFQFRFENETQTQTKNPGLTQRTHCVWQCTSTWKTTFSPALSS